MDFLIQNGINLIIAIQGLGAWLNAPMQFFSSLGYENFYLLILPLLYWCVDASLGLRVGVILLFSTGVNELFKLAFAGPRPYWVSAQVKPLSAETSFGVPSGHAQNAVSVWGMLAGTFKKPWAWVTALALMFLIGFSRLYLGVHFPHDVLAGWLIGAVILTLFLRLWDSISSRVQKISLLQQILFAFAISLVMALAGGFLVSGLRNYQMPEEWLANALRAGAAPAPVSMDGLLTSAGTLFGLLSGAAWMKQMGGYQARGLLWKRTVRYLIGIVGLLILWQGLGAIFPRHEDLVSYVLRFLRYTLVGIWVSGGAPWLFIRFNFADKPK